MSASTTARAFVSEQTCGACAANISAGNHNLCPACEKYVGQDYVSRRELPLPEHELQAVAARLREDKAPAHDSPEELGRFEMFLRRAKLSDREKDVIHMRFVESLNFFSIFVAN